MWIHLIFMILLILLASRLFSNALEHFGQKIGISAGVTGSIFAAVATALPEASVPVIALLAGSANHSVNEEISVGAILGAPLMIATLSIFIMGCSILKLRGLRGRIAPERTGFIRDLNFFLISFALAALAMYVPQHPMYLREAISCILVVGYFSYIYFTCKASKNLVMNGHGVIAEEPMLLTKIGLSETSTTIALQIILGLGLLLFGAHGFIQDVEHISKTIGVSPLVLSLLIIPFATELPEKVNSVFWVRKNQDTLGVGNLTGAMVFQGSVLPALGILLTPWQPSREVETGIFITFVAAAWLRLNISHQGLRIFVLLFNGALYLLYLFLTLK